MSSKRKYYDYSKVRSYNGVYNFIPGARGLGKTYGAKDMGIKNAIRKGEEFIYLRRYKTELSAAKDSFFADIGHTFPDKDLRVIGNRAQMSELINPDDYANESDYNKAAKARVWVTIGYFVALSTAQKQKSVSYPKVTIIIFDEFIIEKGALHYLPNEVDAFNNFYVTVDRFTDRVKVYFLANSVSIMNPYFMAYDIAPDEEREIVRREKGFIVAHFPDSEDFSKDIYQTRFGQFIKGTEYSDFAVGNQFKDNNDSLILVKGYKARYQFTLETETGRFSVWYDMVNNRFFIQEKDNKNPTIYTLVVEKMDEDKTLMTVRDKPLAYLRSAFNTGRVLFDKPNTRNAFREIFKR
jgi:hypothetical protein